MKNKEFHIVEIKQGELYENTNFLKIDGKEINYLRSFEIKCGLDSPYPIVKIEFLAKIESEIKIERITSESETLK